MQLTDFVSFLSLFYELFADCMLIERMTGAFSKHIIILFSECSIGGKKFEKKNYQNRLHILYGPK